MKEFQLSNDPPNWIRAFQRWGHPLPSALGLAVEIANACIDKGFEVGLLFMAISSLNKADVVEALGRRPTRCNPPHWWGRAAALWKLKPAGTHLTR